jgi:hypothetical protein
VTAALDGRDVDEILRETAVARLVNEERKSLPRVEGELLAEFGKRLDAGGADDVIGLLRPRFDKAAAALRSALSTVGIPDDPAVFIESASADQLHAWQSVRPAIETLDRVAAVARQLGPLGQFPCVADPRAVDPSVRCGWLHDVATMCTAGDLMAACVEFQKPAPASDIRSSPRSAVGRTCTASTRPVRGCVVGAKSLGPQKNRSTTAAAG